MRHAAQTILIAGPTASGKSAVAMTLARETGGWVVNTDSMQVYDTWRVLTARPSAEDEAAVPHRLYGHRPVTEWYSVGDWLRELEALCAQTDVPLILTGGTGLYFRAATQGLSPIPAIPAELRAAAETELATRGTEEFRAELLIRDPRAASLDLENPRRMLRAWEVMAATGRSLVDWADVPAPPLLSGADILFRAVLSPPREALNARIAVRFGQMVDAGALEEVARVRDMALDPALPATRAIGFRPLAALLDGGMTREEAVERSVIETRQYAKRQRTWYRNQLGDWPQFDNAAALLAAAREALAGRG